MKTKEVVLNKLSIFAIGAVFLCTLIAQTLALSQASAVGVTFTWTAAGGSPTSMNDQGNWDIGDGTAGDDGVPGFDDIVVIPNVGAGTINNDIAGSPHFRSFTVNANFFQFSGNALYTGSLALSGSPSTFNIAVNLVNDVTAGGVGVINGGGGTIFNQPVNFTAASGYDVIGSATFNAGMGGATATSISFNRAAAGGSSAGGVSIDGTSTTAGTIVLEDGILTANDEQAFGTGAVNVNGGTLRLNVSAVSEATFANDMVFDGGDLQALSSSSDDPQADHGVVILTGSVQLSQNATFSGNRTDLKITGPANGSATFTLADVDPTLIGNSGRIIMQSSSNGSGMPNKTYVPATVTTDYDDETSDPLNVYEWNIAVLTGERGLTNVYGGGVLKGTGTIGELIVHEGGTVAPGLSPGCLYSSDVTIDGTLDIEIGGKVGCSDYDRLNVTGTVDIDGASLDVSFVDDFTPKVGDEFVVVNNDGVDAITGTFSGLPEGDTFKIGKVTFTITYDGGGGENDAVITVVDVDKDAPGNPNTGAGGIKANPMLTGLATLFSTGSIALIVRRFRLFS